MLHDLSFAIHPGERIGIGASSVFHNIINTNSELTLAYSKLDGLEAERYVRILI